MDSGPAGAALRVDSVLVDASTGYFSVRKRLSELAGDVDDLTCVRTEGVNCPIDIDEESRES